MITSRIIGRSLLVFLLSLMTAAVFAQAQPEPNEYQPQVGQEGKDVIWVPTAQALVNKMLDLAKVTSKDYVIDLGSGDGRLVITAAKRGARAQGIEYNTDMVALSKRNAEKEGVSDRARFVQGDLFESDFSQASVITMFLLPDINLRLRPKILDLKPGTRIVSNSFTMAEWTADETVTTTPEDGCDNYFCQAYLWIVPAKVAGTWKLPQGELTLKQAFQMISGTLRVGKNTTQISDGKLAGDLVSFTAGKARYSGRVSGNSMEGAVSSGSRPGKWSATKAD